MPSAPPTRPKDAFETPENAYLAMLAVMAEVPLNHRVTRCDIWQYAEMAHLGLKRNRWSWSIQTVFSYSNDERHDDERRDYERAEVIDTRNRLAFTAYVNRRSNNPEEETDGT